MPVTIDKILGKPLLHSHKVSDITDADSTYVNVSGDVVTGDIIFPSTGMILKDSNNLRWRLTVDTTGALTTTAIVEGTIGSPWLFLFGNI